MFRFRTLAIGRQTPFVYIHLMYKQALMRAEDRFPSNNMLGGGRGAGQNADVHEEWSLSKGLEEIPRMHRAATVSDKEPASNTYETQRLTGHQYGVHLKEKRPGRQGII